MVPLSREIFKQANKIVKISKAKNVVIQKVVTAVAHKDLVVLETVVNSKR